MELSKKRLLNIYKRFEDDKEFLKQYDNVFKEQLEDGIIEEVSKEVEVGQTHYLPHHQVIHNHKATVKLRVVFDAFAASKGPSFLKKKEEFVEKIDSNEFRFRDAGVLEIKKRSDFTKQVNLQEVMDIKHFGSFQKLKRAVPWVFRFFNNLKQKILREPMLLKEILDKKELNLLEKI